MNTSYNKTPLEFEDIFKLLVYLNNPSKIIEFGILEGYSLKAFADSVPDECIIEAYDIFEEFNGNHATKDTLHKEFDKYSNVRIAYGNFYKKYLDFEEKSIDIIHVDIANDGDIYEFAVNHYLPKIRDGGYLILEGGSDDRDNVWWIMKYNKRKISEYLQSCDKSYHVIEKYPSITIIKK